MFTHDSQLNRVGGGDEACRYGNRSDSKQRGSGSVVLSFYFCFCLIHEIGTEQSVKEALMWSSWPYLTLIQELAACSDSWASALSALAWEVIEKCLKKIEKMGGVNNFFPLALSISTSPSLSLSPSPSLCFCLVLSGIESREQMWAQCHTVFPDATIHMWFQWNGERTEVAEEGGERVDCKCGFDHVIGCWGWEQEGGIFYFEKSGGGHGVGLWEGGGGGGWGLCYISSPAALHASPGLLCRETNGM